MDYLLDLANLARSHPKFDAAAAEAHSPARIALDAERAIAAIQRADWRAASNIHYGLAGALGDAADFLGVDLDPTGSFEARLQAIDALDRADARQQWAALPPPTGIHADSDRVVVDLVDGSRVEACFADAHDPVYALMNWLWERYGPEVVYDALAQLLVRPGDTSISHGRSEPLD